MTDNPGTSAIDAFAQDLGKDISTIVKRQFNYLCCFSNNVESMKEAAQNLEDVRAKWQKEIDDSLRSPEDIVPQVRTWLEETYKILNEVRDEIEAKIPNPGSGSWPKIKSPFSLGQKVKLRTQDMEKLLNDASGFNSDNIFHPAPPPAMLPFPLRDALELKSRRQIEDEIIEVLSRGNVNVVGICGMGGVGKTTMAGNILSRMIANGSFDGHVKVVASEPPVDLLKIQQEIIDSLDLKDEEKREETFEARARLLFSKLKGPEKHLIILDDIWETLSLEDLGIPREGGCKTLLTSRDKNVLDEMCDNIFGVETLFEEEAWSLFEKEAGIHMNDPKLRRTAQQIVVECGGLPLAIVTVGRALKNKGKQYWDDALSRLQSSFVDKKVYTSLTVSYDLLDDPDAQLLFLLCCLFPEDHRVSLGDLALYAMGLNMFQSLDTLKAVRREVRQGVHKLKSHFLLLDGDDVNEVKMHDVVRDVGIFIATKEGLMSKGQYNKECKWISVCTTSSDMPLDHLIGTKFPDLCLLIVHLLSSPDQSININNISILEGMQSLSVLSFKKVEFKSSPEEIELPYSLSTLQLVHCGGLKTLYFVGALLNLKILDCNECWGIEELPVQIGRLKCLKLLNLSGCKNLKKIAPDIIKQLVELEELKMLDSFRKWASSKEKDKEGMNVPLNELESLYNLRCLEIEVDDISLVHEKIDLTLTLVEYKIKISEWRIDNSEVHLRGSQNEIINGSWTFKLVAATAKRLEITNWETIEVFISEKSDEDEKTNIMMFPKLRKLILKGLPSLTTFWKGGENSIKFPSLEELEISDCEKLKSIVGSGMESESEHNCGDDEGEQKTLPLFHTYKVQFNKLEYLSISECPAISSLFFSVTDGYTIMFPNLKTLKVEDMPCLEMLYDGRYPLELSMLEEISIVGCPRFKFLTSGTLITPKLKGMCIDKQDLLKRT